MEENSNWGRERGREPDFHLAAHRLILKCCGSKILGKIIPEIYPKEPAPPFVDNLIVQLEDSHPNSRFAR